MVQPKNMDAAVSNFIIVIMKAVQLHTTRIVVTISTNIMNIRQQVVMIKGKIATPFALSRAIVVTIMVLTFTLCYT